MSARSQISMALGGAMALVLVTGCAGDSEGLVVFRDAPYTLPPELTNPLELPADQISVVHEECGPDFHYMHQGNPIFAPGKTFIVGNERCTVDAGGVKQEWFNGAWFACYRCKRSANEIFHNIMDLDGTTDVRIYPIVEPGCHQRPEDSSASSPTTVYTDIFAAVGIDTNGCASDPLSLGQAGEDDNAPGWIAEHDSTNMAEEDDSQVIKPGGSRATFGFFITFMRGTETVEYFVLFSYDRRGTLCATEMFMWGPITRNADGDLTATPPLILGAAINAAGNLIDEVPIDLATASILYEEAATDPPEGRPVRVGTHLPGQGCLECHNGNGGDQTVPFPWDTTVVALNGGCDDDDTDTDDSGTGGGTTDDGTSGLHDTGATSWSGTGGGETGNGGTTSGGGTSDGATSYGGTGGMTDGATSYGGTGGDATDGGTSYGGTGGTSYGATSYGGTSGGTSDGATSYGGTTYGATSDEGTGDGTTYGATTYGWTGGGTTYGGTTYGGTTYGWTGGGTTSDGTTSYDETDGATSDTGTGGSTTGIDVSGGSTFAW
jgi:hypothetical protein